MNRLMRVPEHNTIAAGDLLDVACKPLVQERIFKHCTANAERVDEVKWKSHQDRHEEPPRADRPCHIDGRNNLPCKIKKAKKQKRSV